MTPTEINVAIAEKLGVGSRYHPLRCPNYCGDIAIAWKLIDKMKTPSRAIVLTMAMGDPHWTCHIFNDGNFVCGNGSDTAPMAICLVFLMFVT